MKTAILVALLASFLAGCAGTAARNTSMDDYWRDYGNSHGADANGAS